MPVPAMDEDHVTRTDVVDALGDLFDGRRLTKLDIVEAARRRGVNEQMARVLDRLPERPYWQPQQLWGELPDVPIG